MPGRGSQASIVQAVRGLTSRLPTRVSGGFLMLQPTDLLVGAEMPTRASGGSLTLKPPLLSRLATYPFQFRIVLGTIHRPQREAPTAVVCGHLARECDSVGFNIKNPQLARVRMDSNNANSRRARFSRTRRVAAAILTKRGGVSPASFGVGQ